MQLFYLCGGSLQNDFTALRINGFIVPPLHHQQWLLNER